MRKIGGKVSAVLAEHNKTCLLMPLNIKALTWMVVGGWRLLSFILVNYSGFLHVCRRVVGEFSIV